MDEEETQNQDGYEEASTDSLEDEETEDGDEALESPETDEEAPPAPEPPARRPRLPESVLTAPGAISTEAAERLGSEWGIEPQVVQLMDYLATQKAEAIVAHRMQSHAVANAHYQAEAASEPEFYREYGADVQRALSQLPPALQGSRKGVRLAALYVMNEELGDEGSIGDLLIKAGGYTKAKAQAPAAKPPKAPIPPERRIPTPSLAPRPSAPKSRDSESVLGGVLSDMFGIKGTERTFLELDDKVKR